jgi:hypothetical protein
MAAQVEKLLLPDAAGNRQVPATALKEKNKGISRSPLKIFTWLRKTLC